MGEISGQRLWQADTRGVSEAWFSKMELLTELVIDSTDQPHTMSVRISGQTGANAYSSNLDSAKEFSVDWIRSEFGELDSAKVM